MSGPQLNRQTVTLTRVFDAPRSRVFECWTRAEHLQHWFGPRGFTIHSCETDPRPGGIKGWAQTVDRLGIHLKK